MRTIVATTATFLAGVELRPRSVVKRGMVKRLLVTIVLVATCLSACKGQRESATRTERDEHARIEALLASIAKQSDVTFIRNGREHSAAEAADHLRSKWGGARVTAEQFIERYGTKSSTSGRPYRVRVNGTERDAGPWMHELLGGIARE